MYLEVAHVSQTLNQQPILHDVSLKFEHGKSYCLIGPNGCGKSTLLNILSRQQRPISGRVMLNGMDIADYSLRTFAQHVAILPQHLPPVSTTVKQLISYGRQPYRKFYQGASSKDEEVIKEVMQLTRLSDMGHRQLNTLSGGERQRAWIAMALAQEPELICLDEPTTYLDISHQLEVLQLIQRLNQERGMTVITVLHDLNQAMRYSDELIVMKEGRVQAQGPSQTLLTPEILRDVFRVGGESLQCSCGRAQLNLTEVYG